MKVWGGLLPATGAWLAVRFDSDCSLTLLLDLEGNPPTLAAPSKGCTWVPRAPTRAHSAQALRLEWGTSSPAKERAGPNPEAPAPPWGRVGRGQALWSWLPPLPVAQAAHSIPSQARGRPSGGKAGEISLASFGVGPPESSRSGRD